MKCPFCGDPSTQVTDTRENEDGDIVRRRRRCLKCDKRFTTYERIDLKMPHVVKSDGRRAEFDRAKLLASMTLALRKRPVAFEEIEAAAARIEGKLLAMGERELPSKTIDKVAYVRFASVYRNFEDVDAFSAAIREVSRSRGRAKSG